VLPFKLLFHPGFAVDLGPHVFPAPKYRLVRARLPAEGAAAESDFVAPPPATDEHVLRVHTADYVGRIKRDALGRDREALTVSLYQQNNTVRTAARAFGPGSGH
jgi:acetoin utilization deacetylase AcuC-like enzyme